MTNTTHNGDLIITSKDGSEYAHITVVTGDVCAYDSAQVTLPALTKCRDVGVYDSARLTLPALTKCGDVRGNHNAQVTLPALTECGDVGVYDSAQVTLPALTKCGDVRGNHSAQVTLPALTECGDVCAYDSAQVTLPALTKCRDVSVCDSAQVTLPLIGATIASDGVYQLFRKHSGTYHAGCHQWLTSVQALDNWNCSDKRAKIFTAAIRKAEGMEK